MAAAQRCDMLALCNINFSRNLLASGSIQPASWSPVMCIRLAPWMTPITRILCRQPTFCSCPTRACPCRQRNGRGLFNPVSTTRSSSSDWERRAACWQCGRMSMLDAFRRCIPARWSTPLGLAMPCFQHFCMVMQPTATHTGRCGRRWCLLPIKLVPSRPRMVF